MSKPITTCFCLLVLALAAWAIYYDNALYEAGKQNCIENPDSLDCKIWIAKHGRRSHGR